MGFDWLKNILYGFFYGMTAILPVSSRAHSILLMELFGKKSDSNLMLLLIHLAILVALYYICQTMIVRVSRALSLARIPKKKRKRPLDTKSLMDFRLLRTMLIPVILGYLLYDKVSVLGEKLLWVSILLFVNGVILYVPQFLPGSNKDSRSLSRVDGLLMGLGGALSVLPGISAIGASVSIGSVCGVDRKYALNLALVMSIVISGCLVVFDILRIISEGIGEISFVGVIVNVISAAAAFGGTLLGVKIIRSLVESTSFSVFSFYCWGLALFAFFLNLVA